MRQHTPRVWYKIIVNPIITAVCLSLATAVPVAYANEEHEPITGLMDSRTPLTDLAPTKQPVSQPIPEPNALVALAFAGVVILARHRFRP